MKVYAVSDLHGTLPEIPECDLLILGGDYNPYNRLTHQAAYMNDVFRPWLDQVPAKEIVAIAGNHDFIFQQNRPDLLPELRWHYLQDSGIELLGLKIWGTPWTPTFYKWAFMKDDQDLVECFAYMPQDLDILISHGPPRGILDKNRGGYSCGSQSLLNAILDNRPKHTVFGHIHEAYGHFNLDGQKFYNVSQLDDTYRLRRGPTLIEVD